MTRAIMVAILVAAMLVIAAAAMAAPNHNVKYVKVGVTDDGRPVYVAIIQMNYMNAELAARIFGGSAVSGDYGARARPPVTQGYSGNRDNTNRNDSYSRPYTYTTPYDSSYGPGSTPNY